jgi:hypothetical protein
MVAAEAELPDLEPKLRDVQRANFRDGDEEGLLQTANTIANVLDIPVLPSVRRSIPARTSSMSCSSSRKIVSLSIASLAASPVSATSRERSAAAAACSARAAFVAFANSACHARVRSIAIHGDRRQRAPISSRRARPGPRRP